MSDRFFATSHVSLFLCSRACPTLSSLASLSYEVSRLLHDVTADDVVAAAAAAACGGGGGGGDGFCCCRSVLCLGYCYI